MVLRSSNFYEDLKTVVRVNIKLCNLKGLSQWLINLLHPRRLRGRFLSAVYCPRAHLSSCKRLERAQGGDREISPVHRDILHCLYIYTHTQLGKAKQDIDRETCKSEAVLCSDKLVCSAVDYYSNNSNYPNRSHCLRLC